ncbi:hypothetical protein Pcinc_004861 [Petrolisthes cinctipes]|uniref:Uncharacterized protein n=1 Tax=Petrolisthes cinctipes TaxID=88211 RepID=A0AAE1L140_PETCI|nr:hypothetical protein Pcinc_004861 [Petrolisthes cinctipes]
MTGGGRTGNREGERRLGLEEKGTREEYEQEKGEENGGEGEEQDEVQEREQERDAAGRSGHMDVEFSASENLEWLSEEALGMRVLFGGGRIVLPQPRTPNLYSPNRRPPFPQPQTSIPKTVFLQLRNPNLYSPNLQRQSSMTPTTN